MLYHTHRNDTTDFLSGRFLHISAAGIQKHTRFDVTVERKKGRKDYHILYIKSGKAIVFYEGSKEILSEGCFVLYPPHVSQKYIFLAHDACESYWIHFSGTAAEEILAEAALSGGIYRITPHESISAAFRDIINKGTKALDACAALLSFLSLLGKCAAGEERQNPFAPVLSAMAEDLSRPYQGHLYASLCALSESRFAHKFKEYMGVSPFRFFLSLKLSRAEELLLSSNLSVGEIAATVGFDNQLYFSRLFKKQKGLSPLHYKKQHKGTENT